MANHELLTDDYVAELVAKEAKDASIKYSTMGLDAYKSSRPSDKLKPNTRFLRHIIKETKNHNEALLAKEAAESRARLQDLHEAQDKKRKRYKPGASDMVNRQLNSIAAVLHGGKPKRNEEDSSSGAQADVSDETSRRSRSSKHARDRQERRERKARERSRSPGRGRHRSRSAAAGETESRRHQHRRHRSVDEDNDDHRDKRRRDRSKSPPRSRHRRHRDRTPPMFDESGRRPLPAWTGSLPKITERAFRATPPFGQVPGAADFEDNQADSSGPSNPGPTHVAEASRPLYIEPPGPPTPKGAREWRDAEREVDREDAARAAAEAEAEAEDEDYFGPAPPPGVHIRGRGAPGSSAMDNRFSESYDPTTDLANRGDDFIYEAYRLNQQWRHEGAQRLRQAGFSEEYIHQWKINGGERTVDDVQWTPQGGEREWDRGKDHNRDDEPPPPPSLFGYGM